MSSCIKQWPTLYKIDSKGKTRIYEVYYKDPYEYITEAGLIDGKRIKQTHKITPKSNRTQEEQIEKEAQAAWTKKYERELYSMDLSKPHPLAYIKPMLARDYTKVGHQIDWEKDKLMAQRKLNGVRCIAHYNNGKWKLTSRKGKTYNVPHIENILLEEIKSTPWLQDLTLDGELYIHGVQLGDITHAVSNGHDNLSFHIFDHVNKKLPFLDRYLQLKNLEKVLQSDYIQIVKTIDIFNEKDMINTHNKFVQEGYEGLILRNINGVYEEGTKSKYLFKYKQFKDSEFKIIDAISDKLGGAILILITDDGVTFTSRPKGSNEFRKRLLKHKNEIIGELATVRYSELLDSGVPEFNRTIAIRTYE